MFINGRQIGIYNAKLEADFSVGSMSISNTIQQGRNRTSFILTAQTYGMKALVLPIFFECESAHELSASKSAFDAACTGTVELYLPDGFFYSAVLQSADALELVGETCGRATYSFKGIQHDALRTVAGNELLVHGTAPQMDARLTVIVGTSGADYRLAGAVFDTVTAGDVLCFDGLNSVITRNGINAADECTFLSFPRLVPGVNVIDCADTVTVEYYPVYM